MNTQPANKKTLMGTVVSTKMKDTVTVAVNAYVKHPKYKKYALKTKKYLAHDPGNTVSVGDRVYIRSCRPISKNKHFEIVAEGTQTPRGRNAEELSASSPRRSA